MAAADCTVFAVKGQALRVYGWIKDATTGNPITSIGTLSVAASLDGTYSATYSTGGGSALAATAVSSHNGRFYVDIPATPANVYNLGLTISSNTANALYATIDITFVDLSEKTGHWYAQTVKRVEDMWAATVQYIQNRVTQNNSTEDIRVYAYGSTSSVLYTITVDNDGTSEVKAQAS